MTDATPDKYISEKIGFEPFSSLAGVLSGEQVRIMPLGTFYRDSRKLVITEADLREIESNFKAGLPRFRVPVNENHKDTGKIGTVKAVEFKQDGADGPGLYANLDLTEEGKQLLTRGRYDAVSPEMVWSKAGATYQDPTTGKQHNNTLVGMAITDRPYFSHDNVALFSDAPKRHNGYTKLKAKMKEQFESWLSGLTDEDAADTPAPETVEQPAAVEAASVQGVETMPPEVIADTVEVFSVTKEQFDAMQAEIVTRKAEAEKFAADIKAEKHARRLDQLTVQAEKFSALPIKAAELAEKFAALEEHDPKLFEYFAGLLSTLDSTIATGALFSQMGNGRKDIKTTDTINDVAMVVLAEKFGGDMTHYSEAFKEAGKRRPELAQAFAAGQKD